MADSVPSAASVALSRLFDPSLQAPAFAPDSFWRDLVTFHGSLVTIDGLSADDLAELVRSKFKEEDALIMAPPSLPSGAGPPMSAAALERDGHFTFITRAFEGRGYIHMTDDGAVSSLFTFAERVLPSRVRAVTERAPAPPVGSKRPRGAEGAGRACVPVPPDAEPEGAVPREVLPEAPRVLDCVVVGSGQAGLSLAARLQRMGVRDVLLLERHARVGDNWRRRYESLQLHDPKNACSLPYHPMPAAYPKFVPKDQVGDCLEEAVT